MKAIAPACLAVLLLANTAFSDRKSVFYLLQFRSDNVTNTALIGRFTNALVSAFRDRGFYALDGFSKGPEGEDPDYMMEGKLSFHGDEYAVTLVAVNITNQRDRWQDEVYTRDMTGRDGFREAARALARRSAQLRKKGKTDVYRERTDYLKIAGRADTSGFRKGFSSVELFRILSVHVLYPYGFDFGFPLRFGLDFFDFSYVWPFGTNTTFGAGVGAKVFSYRGPQALSFLPIQAYVPLYVFPSDYEYNRRDLYFHLEAGFFPLHYSYLDVSLKLLFSGISLTVGCLYLPNYSDGTNTRPEYWTVYGGLTISFGRYGVNWNDR